MSKAVCVSVALAMACAPARAQRVPLPSGSCSYVTCALSLRYNRVVAGLDHREVARFGWFAEPELRPLIEASDSAAHYYGIVERDYPAGSYTALAGMLISTVGYGVVRAKSEAEAQWIGGGLLVAGLTLAAFGWRKQRKARDALRTSLAWYNNALLDAADSDPSAPADLPFGRQALVEPGNHGRAGAVVGTLAGIGIGLAVSSRDSSITVGQGLAETAALGAVGGLLGWRIGLSFPRY